MSGRRYATRRGGRRRIRAHRIPDTDARRLQPRGARGQWPAPQPRCTTRGCAVRGAAALHHVIGCVPVVGMVSVGARRSLFWCGSGARRTRSRTATLRRWRTTWGPRAATSTSSASPTRCTPADPRTGPGVKGGDPRPFGGDPRMPRAGLQGTRPGGAPWSPAVPSRGPAAAKAGTQ